ncbi:MAG: hypothetical protein NXI04_13755 [Planctomycetaceae bacterium]|nr:hypothetical protein [Planctomycetaceae bacterium]
MKVGRCEINRALQNGGPTGHRIAGFFTLEENRAIFRLNTMARMPGQIAEGLFPVLGQEQWAASTSNLRQTETPDGIVSESEKMCGQHLQREDGRHQKVRERGQN